MDPVEVREVRAPADVEGVARLLESTPRDDVHRLVSDSGRPGPDHGQPGPATGLAAWRPGRDHPVGYARMTPKPSGFELELAVASDCPTPGAVTQDLLAAAVDSIGACGGGHLTLWVHEPTDEHDAVAAAAGLHPDRELYQMRRPLPAEQPLELPLRPFVPGVDDQALLEVNNRAFAGHPDQGGWTLERLRQVEDEPWFDPEGLLVHERDGRLAGFCWTKVHSGEPQPLGELYVLAVDPDFQGRGLGRALVVAGLRWLSHRGLEVGMLYVDAANQVAVGLYRSLGFTVHHVDRSYETVVSPTSEPRA